MPPKRTSPRATDGATAKPTTRSAKAKTSDEQLQLLSPEERAAREATQRENAGNQRRLDAADEEASASVEHIDDGDDEDAAMQGDEPVCLASVLEPGTGFGDVADEQPVWLRKMFPDGAWSFPVCDTKDGHLSGQLDPVHQVLQRQA